MKILIIFPGKAKFELLRAIFFRNLFCMSLLFSQENNVLALIQDPEDNFNQITSLETVNSFYAQWCCVNGGYLYGTGLTDHTVVLRKTENGQAVQTRGSVAVLDPSFKIEDKIFSTTTPGLIFIPVMKSGVFFLLKSNDGGATFRNVFTFGEGNGPNGTNTPNVRLLRGILELTTEIPDGGGVGTLYIGEYNVCHPRSIGSTNDRVRIMKSVDNGDTWTKVVEWNTNGINQVGHIHAMKQDPYTGEIYICMGDGNSKAGIIKWDGSSEWADNRRLSEIGQMGGFKVLTGTQRYRVCDVLFDENYFYTFADTQTPNNPTGSESGIWRGRKDFSSFTRMDNQIYEYDPMHIGWFGEKIGDTFIFTTAREYINPANAWKELNTQVYVSSDGENWHTTGLINWRDREDPATSRYINNLFTYNNKVYIDCVGGAGHNSTIQCELSYKWKTYEDPVILHPVYFVGTWNAPGNDANLGITPDAPKRTLNNILTSSHISAGARVKVAEGSFYETEINPDWSAALLQGRGSVIIEGQGMNETRIIRSSGSGTTHGIQIEASKTLTNSRTPFILKDLEIYLTVDGGANHSNYVLSNVNSYIKTISCRIGNNANDDSPLIKLSNQGSKYVSENSFHVANSGTSIYRNIVRSGASGTICHLKNCIILNAYNAFVNDYPGFDFSLKNCNLYAIEHAGVLFESTSAILPVIKNCIFSCGEAPIISHSATTNTQINYNLYNKAMRNISDGGHSLIIGTDPLFVDANNGNFNLRSGSPCSGTGIYLSDVLYDFTYRARENPPSIGAYESTFPYETNTLSVTPAGINIASAEGASGSFNINSNTYWNLSCNETWLNISPLSGVGDGTITVTSSSPNTLITSRSASVIISVNGTNPLTVSVIQSGENPDLNISPQSISLASTAGATAIFNITSNTDWNISYTEPWLDVSSLSGNGNETITVTTISSNNSTSPRSSNITISAEEISPVYITVTQSGQSPALSVSPESILIDSISGATGSFTVVSNTDWKVSYTSDWFTMSSTSGTGNSTLTVTTTTSNTLTRARIASLIFSANGVRPATVTITQSGQNPLLTVSEQDITIAAFSGATGEINIKSNTGWNVSCEATWLNISSISGIGNETIVVTATSENKSEDTRSSSITFSTSGVNPVTVKITQSGQISTSNPEIKKLDVNIYPNPVSGLLKIEYNDGNYKSILILNSQGKVLIKEKVISPVQLIDFSKYEHGLYILEFVNPGDKSLRVKVVNY